MAGLEPGHVVDKRYRLDKVLGKGGMGEVWAATQVVTGQAVALKFLHDDPEGSEQARRRFLREARAACAVRHPNVVLVHDVVELADGTPVIVMERLEGQTLGQYLAERGKLSVPDFARLMLPAVSALGTAHAHGVVHRDLKPDNIFLAKSATGEVVVKVLDFGVAKLLPTQNTEATAGLTETGSMLGTPSYMAPEQASGEKDIDHRADIWSLGIIFYRCLTGILPTRGDNLGQTFKIIMIDGIPSLAKVAPDVPADVAELVGKMLAQSRRKRLPDLREAQAVLLRHADLATPSFGDPVPPPASSTDLPAAADDSSEAATIDAGGFASASSVTTGPSPLAKASVGDPETHPPTVVAVPRPRRLAVPAVAGAAVTVAVLAFVALRLNRPRDAAPPAVGASETAVAQAPTPVAPAPPPPSTAAPVPTPSDALAPRPPHVAGAPRTTAARTDSASSAAPSAAAPRAASSATASSVFVEKPPF